MDALPLLIARRECGEERSDSVCDAPYVLGTDIDHRHSGRRPGQGWRRWRVGHDRLERREGCCVDPVSIRVFVVALSRCVEDYAWRRIQLVKGPTANGCAKQGKRRSDVPNDKLHDTWREHE